MSNLPGLTTEQNQFLDRFIRKNTVKGRGKKKRAQGYSASRQALEAEFARLPTSDPNYPDFKEALNKIDEAANDLKFNRAQKLADKLAADVKTAADAFPVDEFINAYKTEVDQFVQGSAQDPAQKLQTVIAWRANTAPGLLAQIQVIPDDDLPDRNQLGDSNWIRALDNKIQIQNDLILQAQTAFETNLGLLLNVSHPIKELPGKFDPLSARGADLAKGCRTQQDQQKLQAERAKLDNVRATPSLQSPGDNTKFITQEEVLGMRDALNLQLNNILNPAKLQIQDLREELRAGLQEVQAGRNSSQGAKDGVSEKLKEEFDQDFDAMLNKTTETGPRAIRPMGRFNAAPFFQSGSKYTMPNQQYDANSDEVKQQTAVGKNTFREFIRGKNLDPNGDEIFDLLLKSPQDFAREYANARGWFVPDPNEKKKKKAMGLNDLPPGQKAQALAFGKGMHQAALEFQPNKIDLQGNPKTVMIGNEKYVGGTVIGQGGFGKILKFQAENDPQKTIVVKSMLTEDPKQRSSIVREVKNHRYLMQGDQKARGRDNVIDMKGTVQGEDGSLHMIMESMEGGDLDQNRLGLTVASELGVLPEEARTVLNQHRVKQAVEGMIYMRDQNFVHFDIKGANFLMTPEGKLKVIDFGSSEVGNSPDGKVKVDGLNNEFTAGYGEGQVKETDNKFDTFAMGKLIQVMQQNLHDPPTAGWKTDRPPDVQGLTGALDRLTSAMTNQNSNARLSLDGVLESSYMKNLDNYSEKDIEELNRATIAYSKAIRKETAQVKAQLNPQELELARPQQKTTDDIGMSDIIATAEGVIHRAITDIEKLRKEFSTKGITRERRFEIEAQITAITKDADNWKAKISLFGQSPEAKELAAKIKDLSTRLTHPSNAGDDQESIKEFRKTLASTVNDPGSFLSFVRLTSSGQYLEKLGVDPRALVKIASVFEINTSETNDKAPQQLAAARDQVRGFLATIKDQLLQRTIGAGLLSILKSVQGQIERFHGKKV